ncbi:4Fe-4S dicluster domain-containing protein [Silvanigrella paludirubra]|jgi:NADH-quinone oxidoreductase subunit I|uniref:NADH-quinone oxidoreductase subunit I n=1 Tax=Silvanigrella paludirubra TaxID=2499159 RepID=A0A6N6VR32_9BACT|nr:NADH-quinone oxidoreductase subunit I [Silvanigrella paludirubra]KAB8037812.1 4Fe-4S dicluster domain-containing protein [Silvanigrella paludirubra]
MGYINVSKDPQKSLKNGYLSTTLLGLGQTISVFAKQLLKLEDSVTIQWPEVEYQYSERFKGAHFLTKRPTGEVRCTACFLCATNCPAQCITIVAGQSKDKGIEKYPVRFEIDILRCVFCGYCEEACPVDAIRLGSEYSMAGLPEQKWVYTKDYLLNRPENKKRLGDKQISKKEENVKDESVSSNLPNIHRHNGHGH